MKNLVFVLLINAFVFSCKKKETPAPAYIPPNSSFGLIYTKVFVPSCGLSGCHANESHDTHSHGVTLEGETTFANMINAVSKNSEAAAANLKIVIPGDTSKSFLYQKLIYNRSIYKFGSPMPSGGLSVSNNQIEFIRQWIQAGAPLNGHVADSALMK